MNELPPTIQKSLVLLRDSDDTDASRAVVMGSLLVLSEDHRKLLTSFLLHSALNLRNTRDGVVLPYVLSVLRVPQAWLLPPTLSTALTADSPADTLMKCCEASQAFSRALWKQRAVMIGKESFHGVLTFAAMDATERSLLLGELLEQYQSLSQAAALVGNLLSQSPSLSWKPEPLRQALVRIREGIPRCPACRRCAVELVRCMDQVHALTPELCEELLPLVPQGPFPPLTMALLCYTGRHALRYPAMWGKTFVDVLHDALNCTGNGNVSEGRAVVWGGWIAILRAVRAGLACGSIATGNFFAPIFLNVLRSCPLNRQSFAAEIILCWGAMMKAGGFFFDCLPEIFRGALAMVAFSPEHSVALLDALLRLPGHTTPLPVSADFMTAVTWCLRDPRPEGSSGVLCRLLRLQRKFCGGSMWKHSPHVLAPLEQRALADQDVMQAVLEDATTLPQRYVCGLLRRVLAQGNQEDMAHALSVLGSVSAMKSLVSSGLWRSSVENSQTLPPRAQLALLSTVPYALFDTTFARRIIRQAMGLWSLPGSSEEHQLSVLTVLEQIVQSSTPPTWNSLSECMAVHVLPEMVHVVSIAPKSVLSRMVAFVAEFGLRCSTHRSPLVTAAAVHKLLLLPTALGSTFPTMLEDTLQRQVNILMGGQGRTRVVPTEGFGLFFVIVLLRMQSYHLVHPHLGWFHTPPYVDVVASLHAFEMLTKNDITHATLQDIKFVMDTASVYNWSPVGVTEMVAWVVQNTKRFCSGVDAVPLETLKSTLRLDTMQALPSRWRLPLLKGLDGVLAPEIIDQIVGF